MASSRIQMNAGDQHELGTCPFRVVRPIMEQYWKDLTFLHYRYPYEEVARLLPRGLVPDVIDGSAWVSLVPFVMQVDIPNFGPVPHFSHFPETNIRTYVKVKDGSRGIWFLSLDAARLSAVITARLGYKLPYFWSNMSVEKSSNSITYLSKRQWPNPKSGYLFSSIEIGEQYNVDEVTPLHHALSAQWQLFAYRAGVLTTAYAEHPPWTLFHASINSCQTNLLEVAGFTKPLDEPIVQFSPGVKVKISLPSKIVV